MPDPDVAEIRYPVVADEPVEVMHPRRQLRLAAALFAAAIILSAAASAYLATVIAYDRAADHTDTRIAALEKDLAIRRAARAQADAQTRALLDQYRRTVCVLAEGRQGPEFDQLRVDFGCANLPPAPSPSPSVSPTPGGTPDINQPDNAGRSLRSSGGSAARPPARSGSGQTPAPQPAPSPSPDRSLLPCLPLVPCVEVDAG